MSPSQAREEQLGEAIAELSARIQAATYELLILIREFDAGAGWNTGFRSCAHWLNWRTGLDLGAAREKVRVARALAELPLLSAAMQRGQLTYSKVRALTRVATPANERSLFDFARCGTAAHVERLVRGWRRVDRVAEARDERRRHETRQLRTWVDADGMVVIHGRLSPEVGAVVQRALEAASERVYKETAGTDPCAAETTAGQRRADALGLVAETALAADLDRGTAGDRYQVVVHVDDGVLEHSDVLEYDDASRQSALEDGPYVSAETSRRIACDAATVLMRHDRAGKVLDVGRKTRTVPPARRRALSARDRRCRFPGCSARQCDAHHVRHWAQGGPTRLDNLVLLCRRHHRAVHEEGFTVTLRDDGEASFAWPDGRALLAAPLPPTWKGTPLAPSTERLAAGGIAIDASTATPHWHGERLDLAYALDVLWRPRTSHRRTVPPRQRVRVYPSDKTEFADLPTLPRALANVRIDAAASATERTAATVSSGPRKVSEYDLSSCLQVAPLESRAASHRGTYGPSAMPGSRGVSSTTAPVLDTQAGHASHAIEVGRHQRGVKGKGVRSDGGIDVLNPGAPSLQCRFDAAIHLTDGVGPVHSRELRAEEVEASLQRAPTLRASQPLDAVRDLRQRGLRDRNFCRRGRGQPVYDRSAALHQR